MARIDSRLLFLTTSPRTPEKMIPEIDLLIKHFDGQRWNNETQRSYMDVLRQEQFFNGNGEKDPAFSARDRINRAPKSLGFVSLSPIISLTPAGKTLLTSKRKEEVFLRQLLKFQIPSPYHKPTRRAAHFCVKPYLELLRLVRTMGVLRFDELQIFGMQLTDWHEFDALVNKIEVFRQAKVKNKGNYRKFKNDYLRNELKSIYADRIARGEIRTREAKDASLDRFLETQSGNMRDYADACFRYLRATGLVNVSHIGKSLSIVPERIDDVDYILTTVDRDPCHVDDELQYVSYLGDDSLPLLYTDDKHNLIAKLRHEFPRLEFDEASSIDLLKDLFDEALEKRKIATLDEQVKQIKDYKQYEDIQSTFEQIRTNALYDAPLILEWNMWRAMTMLDGGDVRANLKFDDFGNPISTAQGNMADIVCDYGDYILTVEVTLSSGQKQYETEGEPVSRHLGKIKKSSGKPCYCLFVAPFINEACVAHFYVLQKMNISYYGGKSHIIPLPLSVFRKMLEDSHRALYVPNPKQIRNFLDKSVELANACTDEILWFEKLQQCAVNWLSVV